MRCQDCRTETAFHAWSAEPLPAGAVSCSIVLTEHVNIPPGKRAMIELVTATISVPNGERALLRLYTSLGHSPSNLDLTFTQQGEFQGLERLITTHALRVYSDHLVEFGVARNNTATEGYAFVLYPDISSTFDRAMPGTAGRFGGGWATCRLTRGDGPVAFKPMVAAAGLISPRCRRAAARPTRTRGGSDASQPLGRLPRYVAATSKGWSH
jgi:hypothetical protein